MKYCNRCGCQLQDEAVVCVRCGQSVPVIHQTDGMKFCSHCGNQIHQQAVICPFCGCSATVNQTTYQQNTYGNMGNSKSVLDVLSERYKINGIIWIVIAGLQILLGITNIVGYWFTMIVGALNLVFGIKDINYSKELLTKPTGIVDKVKPLTGPIITLVYNLIIGGVIGVAGAIYYLIAIRQYVMDNESTFREYENGFC